MKVKRTLLTAVIFSLAAILILTGPAIGADKDKYGGVVKVIVDKPATAFGWPPKIRAADQEYAAVCLETPIQADVNGKLHPHLALSWDLAEDGKSYIVKLRKGVQFHDGAVLDAEAFKFNMDMWVGKPVGAFTTITSVDVIDNTTVRLNSSEFNSVIPYELATEAYLVSPKAVKENGPKWAETHPVGTGPFKFVSYERGASMKWVRFDDYWQKGLPYLDGVEYLFIRDPMTSLSVVKSGDAHGIFWVNWQHAKMLAQQGWQVTSSYIAHLALYGDSINPDSVWAKKKVREAVEYAIDKDAICKQLGLGYPESMYQIVLPSSSAYVSDLKPRKYDPKKAKQLLAEAGYPKGFNAEMIYLNVGWKEGYEAVQSYLSQVGVNIKLTPVARPKFVALRFKGGLPKGNMAQLVCSLPSDALYMMRALLASTANHVPEMKRPEGFDALLTKAVSEKDPQKRLELTHQLVKMAYDEVMLMPFYAEALVAAMNPKVHDSDFFDYGHATMSPFTKAYLGK